MNFAVKLNFCSVTASYKPSSLHVLKEFRQRYPKVEIQLTTGDQR